MILNNFFNLVEEFIQNSNDNLEFFSFFTISFNDVLNVISTLYIHEQNKIDGNIKILEIFSKYKKKLHNRKIKRDAEKI
jgi:hypothetical protein